MTGSFQLIAITNFDAPLPLFLADPGLNGPPHSWTVIPPKFTLSRHVEVLIAHDSTILVVDATEARDEVCYLTFMPFDCINYFTIGERKQNI